MKKCPFCGENIEDEAKFCLYCMRSLEDKKKIEKHKVNNAWKIILPSALAVVLITSLVVVLLNKPKDSADTNVSKTQSENSSYLGGNIILGSIDVSDDKGEFSKEESKNSTYSKVTVNEEISSKSTASKQTSSKNVSSKNVSSKKESSQSNASSKEDSKTESNKATDENSAPESSNKVNYQYRNATSDDTVSGRNFDNCIVITKALNMSSNGTYVLPEYIDGKKVICVDKLAFSNEKICSTVRKVVVPKTIKMIQNNAFYKCVNLSELYICGDEIFISVGAFVRKPDRRAELTIYASYSCSNMDYGTIRGTAEVRYGAKYKEWKYNQ